MTSVPGIFDGELVRPLERITAEPNTPVTISFPDRERFEDFGDRLLKAGLISKKPTGERFDDSPPVKIDGPPLSQTISEQRDEGL